MTIRILLAGLAASVLAAACSTEAPEPQAQELTLTDLQTIPGYAWFPPEHSIYAPNTDMVNIVRTSFSDTAEKLCIFVKPSCSCRGTMRMFPQMMKTLTEAGVDMSRVEIWSVRALSDKHPYSSVFTLRDLPSAFVLKNGVVKSEVVEDEYNEHNADTLIATALQQ